MCIPHDRESIIFEIKITCESLGPNVEGECSIPTKPRFLRSTETSTKTDVSCGQVFRWS